MIDNYILLAIDKNVTIAYYWLNEEAISLAWSISTALDDIKKDLNKNNKSENKLIKRIEDLKDDINVFQKSHNLKFKKNNLIIDEQFSSTLELKVLWLTQQNIMNLFNMGSFELGFIILMEVAKEWNLLYQMIIPNLQKIDTLSKQLYDWSLQHAMFAIDLFEKDFVDEVNKLYDKK